MNRKYINQLFPLLLAVLLISGCAAKQESQGGMSTLGAVGVGAGVGAATGALVGSSIANGDILMSAGAGAGIGAGAVLATRYAYRKYHENKEIKGHNAVISENYQQIKGKELELEEYRRHVTYESNGIQPSDETNRHFEGIVN